MNRIDNVLKNKRFQIFFVAYLIFMIAAIPTLILGKGMFIYYGDYNVQQIPFYMHVHDAIRSGNWLYDWSTDLGGSLLGCYSFYLTGSPFFWLTIPFKTASLPYVMPWIIGLKYAVMASCAYAYARKHLKTDTGAFIAALLFSFSGYQGAVLVYHHFHDSIAFFPLYLLLFERAMEDKKRLEFTLMTAFMAIINYYFFVGQAVFFVIYFAVKYFFVNSKWRVKIRLMFRAFWCGVTGLLLASIYLVPAVYYTTGNSRLTDVLLGYDLIGFKEPAMFMGIIKNIVMLPDVSGHRSMFNFQMSRVSGIGGYLPLVSIAGVIAYFMYNKSRDYMKRLIVTCAVFALVPVLNSMFSALNSEYYARWYYMPVLIMAVMSASMLETREIRAVAFEDLKKSTIITGTIIITISLMALLPARTEDNAITVLGALTNPEQLLVEIILSAVCAMGFFLYIMFLSKKEDYHIVTLVILASFAVTVTMMLVGTTLVPAERRDGLINQVLKGESPFEKTDEFYRIETEEDDYNYPMYWGEHTITSFISTIPSSTIEFYEGIGVRRKVTSHLSTDKIGTRALLSTKYFLQENEPAIEVIGRVDDIEKYTSVGFNEAWSKNGFTVYENQYYVPMGFVFDEYVTETEYNERTCSKASADRMLMRAVIVDDDVAECIEGIVKHADMDEYNATSTKDYYRACLAKQKTACTNFRTSTHGFTADKVAKDNEFVFFSVPYEDGFAAYIDGIETSIYRVDYGFMGIVVPAGEHKIEFKYSLHDIEIGRELTIIGILSFLIELAVLFLDLREKEIKKEPKTLD